MSGATSRLKVGATAGLGPAKSAAPSGFVSSIRNAAITGSVPAAPGRQNTRRRFMDGWGSFVLPSSIICPRCAKPVAQTFLSAVSQVFQPAAIRLSFGFRVSADKNVGDTAGRNACATLVPRCVHSGLTGSFGLKRSATESGTQINTDGTKPSAQVLFSACRAVWQISKLAGKPLRTFPICVHLCPSVVFFSPNASRLRVFALTTHFTSGIAQPTPRAGLCLSGFPRRMSLRTSRKSCSVISLRATPNLAKRLSMRPQ